MSISKWGVQRKGNYDIESYYEDLIYKYNPDNSLISTIKINSKSKFIERVAEMMSSLLDESVNIVIDEYNEELESYWEGQGEYIVQCTNYGFLNGIAINAEKLK